jgi:hypothetical protein
MSSVDRRRLISFSLEYWRPAKGPGGRQALAAQLTGSALAPHSSCFLEASHG